MQKADLTIAETQAPEGRYCSSGHQVSATQVFKGAEVRWFRVSSKTVNGVYCEPCLVLANLRARAVKAGP